MGDMRVHDHLDDLGRGRVISVNYLRCHLGVKAGPLVEQLQQLTADVTEEQRTSSIETYSLHRLGQSYSQPNHSMVAQCCPRGRGEHRTAAERQDTRQGQKLRCDLLLEASERRLAVIGENVGYRLSGPLDDDRVGVVEGNA